VLQLASEGLTDPEIAESLVISKRTVSAHLRSVYRKLGVSTRTAAARLAIEHGLL
jgi:DNA-binding NarL/FixJ family response regulator